MLRANLAGQIRQTNLPVWKPLLPLFEAVMNSVQAVQDRGREEARRIIVNLLAAPSLKLDDSERIDGFVIVDEGVGFTDENMDSFNTAYSDHKLARGGKGVGRFLWLKAFEKVEIDSVFSGDENGPPLRRAFAFDRGYDPDDVEVADAHGARIGTTVTLSGFLEPFRRQVPLDLEFVAQRMCEHFVLLLMRPDCPTIELRSGRSSCTVNDVFEESFRRSSSRETLTVQEQTFEVHGFRLAQPRAARHRLIYCADERAVLSENLDDHLPNLSGRLNDEEGGTFVYLAVVTGGFLNAHVNQERTAFDIDDETDADAQAGQGALFAPVLRRAEIRNACLEFVRRDLAAALADINRDALRRVENYVAAEAPHYRVLLKRAPEFIERIPRVGNKADLEAALHRELHQREVEMKREGSRIITEAAKLEDYEAYRERLSEFLESNNELGVAALAQYVMHRRIVLELFEKALGWNDAKRYPLEKVLHQIIFPMRSSSDETLYSQQNLWLLDERLNYHSVIHSDVALRSVEGLASSSAMRPDLLAFDREHILTEGSHPITALTVVEFKRPMRDDYTDEENPLNQVFKTVEEIRSNGRRDANGRTIAVADAGVPTNCYIVCDLTERLRRILLDRDATETPDRLGFYGYNRNHRIYYEVLDYGKVLADAKRRNMALFDKLKLL